MGEPVDRPRSKMDNQSSKSASMRTARVLLVAFIAFQLGGYATRFSWSNGGWAATFTASALLIVILFLLPSLALWLPKLLYG